MLVMQKTLLDGVVEDRISAMPCSRNTVVNKM